MIEPRLKFCSPISKAIGITTFKVSREMFERLMDSPLDFGNFKRLPVWIP